LDTVTYNHNHTYLHNTRNMPVNTAFFIRFIDFYTKFLCVKIVCTIYK